MENPEKLQNNSSIQNSINGETRTELGVKIGFLTFILEASEA